MEFWAVPYLIIYGLFFLLWMVGVNRQIMFWLYLWQLKEYHFGRFKDHFSTRKGKKIFLNSFFILKIVLLVAGVAIISIPPAKRPLIDYSDYLRQWLLLYPAVLGVVFLAGTFYTAVLFFRKRLLHPDLTKKSIMLIFASHAVLYGAALIVYFTFLGEMSLFDLSLAGFILLFLDILAPVAVSAVVLGLQPLTIYEKNRILRRAGAIIDQRPDLLVIGIAGSYGKSITKELLAHILAQDFCVIKTLANQNTEIGVASRIISSLKPEHRVFICEIGAVHRGRIKQVAQIIKPKIGILTGINQQHLAVFGSQKNIIDAKYEIIEALPADGVAILNWQSRIIRESFDLQKSKIKAQKVIFTAKDIVADNIGATVDDLSFEIVLDNRTMPIKTNARGAFMIEPILLAIAGAVSAGMRFERAIGIINQTDFSQFNLDVSGNTAGISIISSTYSANPDGVASHLDYLKLWPGKKAIIMPCLIELGSASKEVHFDIGKKIAQTCDLAIITTKERFDDIKKGAISAGMNAENIIFTENAGTVDKIIKNRLSTEDVILLEGRLAQPVIGVFTRLLKI